jgi:HSP20 family molecular chaperone IbpA
VNVLESSEGYLIDYLLDKANSRTVRVEVKGRDLVVKGLQRQRLPLSGYTGQPVKATIRLPADGDLDGLRAEVVNGLLRIRLPKTARH